MKDPIRLSVYPHTPEMFNSLSQTHPTNHHAFYRLDPHSRTEQGYPSIEAYIPSDEKYSRGKRAAEAIRRLYEPGVPFHLEVRGMTSAPTIAEYQLWTMSDWVGGMTGSSRAGMHFQCKSLEEYVEMQNDISDESDGVISEFGDSLFCTSAFAANNRIDLAPHVSQQLNKALPNYAKRTTKKPLRFDEIDKYIRRYPELPLRFARVDDFMNELLNNMPTTYVDPRDGMCQSSAQRQIRIYRTLLSEALRCFSDAACMCSDDEFGFDGEKESAHEQAGQLLARSFLLTLLVAAHSTSSKGFKLDDVIVMNMRKITSRVSSGQSATKVA